MLTAAKLQQHQLMLLQAKEVPSAGTGNAWASEYDAQQEAQDHEDVWRQFNGARPFQLVVACCTKQPLLY